MYVAHILKIHSPWVVILNCHWGKLLGWKCLGENVQEGRNFWGKYLGDFPRGKLSGGNIWGNFLGWEVSGETAGREMSRSPCRITSCYVQWLEFVTLWLTHRQTCRHTDCGCTSSSATWAKNWNWKSKLNFSVSLRYAGNILQKLTPSHVICVIDIVVSLNFLTFTKLFYL